MWPDVIVFSGVVLYKITYHLDKHDKDHDPIEQGPIRYRHVNGDQTEIEGDDDVELWMSSVQDEIRHNGHDKNKAYETESIGIQMGLPTVQVENIDDEEEDEDDSVRHRIT